MNYEQIEANGRTLIERTIKLWLTDHPERDIPNPALCSFVPVQHVITKRIIGSQIDVALANGNGALAVYRWKNLDKKNPVCVGPD
jgi:hypothetical protein